VWDDPPAPEPAASPDPFSGHRGGRGKPASSLGGVTTRIKAIMAAARPRARHGTTSHPTGGRTTASPATATQRAPRSLVGPLAIGVGVVAALLAVWVWRGSTAAPAAGSGSLTLTSRPAGAVFLVDGQPQGTTPSTVSLSAGPHLLEIRSGGPTQLLNLHMLEGGQISRYFDLPVGTAPARLQVKTRPAGALVSVDGRLRGKSPLVVTDLNPGPHRVRASIDTQSLERTMMMESGANGAVTLTFDNPDATPPAGHGFLAVTVPIEVRAFENGKPVGMTRAMPWQLPAGHHELEIVNELLGVRERLPVDILEGRIHGLEIAIPPAALSVTTSVPAEIVIDGAALGAAPVVRHPVTAGQHDVIVRHPVLGERRLLVTVLPGAAVDVQVDLKKN
jgi:hypothetical protein